MQNRKRVFILGTVLLLIAIIAANYTAPYLQLHHALKEYSNVIKEGIPENTSLTIYYLDPLLLTRIPVSMESIKSYSSTKMITVEYEELAANLSSLEKLTTSCLHPFQGEYYTDARMYYVFEFGNDGKQLEVSINAWYESACVNGVPVKYDPVLLEIVFPFLTDDARTKFELQQPQT